MRQTAAREMTGIGGRITGPTRQLLKEIKRFFIDPAPLPVFAGAPSGGIYDAESENGALRILKEARTSMFNTGEMPDGGSPSWRIAQWMPVRVRQRAGRHNVDIGYRTAQKEVDVLRRSTTAVHEHIAYEAARLCERIQEVREHTLHIVAGTLAEDYVFAPGEKFEDLYARQPRRVFRNATEFSMAMGLAAHQSPSLVAGIFDIVRRIWESITKKPERDPFRPYFAHFDRGPEYEERGLSLLGGDLLFRSALERIIMYWKIASAFYETGDRSNAFCALGHIIHLVSDLHVPAHVHNDTHTARNPDSLERWLERADYPDIRRNQEETNVRIWTRGPLSECRPDATWNSGNIEEKLTEFINKIIRSTQRFRSVDAAGRCPGQNRTGKLTDDECYAQASILVPAAISACAQVIVNFLEQNKQAPARCQGGTITAHLPSKHVHV